MILFDYNQLAISNIMAQVGNHTNVTIEEDLVRHMVLNKIRSIRQKFKSEQNVVIACDGKNSWRKRLFPLYKANRKKDREASDFDWPKIYEVLNKIRDELRDYFPYVVIHFEGAEADDLIGTLVMKYGQQLNTNDEKLIIVSGDKDFIQLHQYANVVQYDPVHNRLIQSNDPSRYIMEHIIKGDRGDGIPNILSPDNSLVEGIRQKKITEKFIKSIIEQGIENQSEDVKRGFHRNQALIDLSFVPDQIKQTTEEIFNAELPKCPFKRSKMFNYFITYKLKNLVEFVGDF
jgi:5'-3' exonuclease